MDVQQTPETKHKKYKKQKIDTYVSVTDLNRLNTICKKYGYSSIYQLLQYLVHCFLRVADPDNDPIVEPVPDEIRSMFISPKEYARLNRQLKGDTSTVSLEIQLLIPFDEYSIKKAKKLTISKEGIRLSDEIAEEFAGNAEWEKSHHSFGSHKGMIVRQKPDQRKIQTANDIQ